MEVGDAMEVEEEADISGEGHPELYIVYWVIYTIFYILVYWVIYIWGRSPRQLFSTPNDGDDE